MLKGISPPARHVYDKFNIDVLNFDPGYPALRRTACQKFVLLSEVRRILNMSWDQLWTVCERARRQLLHALPGQVDLLLKIDDELWHESEDTARTLMGQMANPVMDNQKNQIELAVLKQVIRAPHCADAWVSASNFFTNIIPAARTLVTESLYRRWLDYVLREARESALPP
jgi:hypothetical protein